jgi:hypothetical protein
MTNGFFDYDNVECYEIREHVAQLCLDDMISCLNVPDNKVALFDGTNTTEKRRKRIADQVKEKLNCKYQMIWI